MSGDTLRPKPKLRQNIKEPTDDVDSNLDETSRVQDYIQSMLSDDSEDYDSDNRTETDCSLNSFDTSSNLQLISDRLHKNGTNKSFSTYQLREIERSNSVLMNRIMRHGTRKNQFPVEAAPKQNRSTSNLINRKKKQKEIDQNNMLLLKRIQSIKPFGLSRPKK